MLFRSGPKRATEKFKNQYPEADKFKIILYGSLALTGKGHLTDYIIKETLSNYEVEIIFDTETPCNIHPNTFDIFAYKNNNLLDRWRIYSVGGGTFKIEGEEASDFKEVYPHKNFNEIKEYVKDNNIDLFDYVCLYEGKEKITEYLYSVWNAMQNAIEKGLASSGPQIIPCLPSCCCSCSFC